MQYILSADKNEGCILCDKPSSQDDEENYILFRGKYNFIILNTFPYTPGHLMVAPYRHTGNIIDLRANESREHVKLIQLCVKLLMEEAKPAGFNIGMNLGRVAGAGLEGHIHTHIVPRWNGDNNFMAVIADVRVLSEGLATTYKKLKTRLNEIIKFRPA
jgi:ATP adenylyltransferase